MTRFLVGLIVGLLALGAYAGYGWYRQKVDACLGRCGPGTQCVDRRCLVAEAPPLPGGKKTRRRRAHGPRGEATEVALRRPSPADLRTEAQGPPLGGAERLDFASEETGGRELSSVEIEATFRSADDKILGCIERARSGYDIVQGKVVVGFRIERTGQVKNVRVSAPALLQRAGLHGCIRSVVASLRFAASSRASILSYPYELR
jgi:hypothetical protein